jgi:hypothetical protein
MNPRRLALVILAAALPLTACGKMGDLERPGPLFGNKAAADATPRRQPPPAVSTVDRRDLDPDPDGTTDLTPIRSRPIQGSGQDPMGTRPTGALPNPYANPQ